MLFLFIGFYAGELNRIDLFSAGSHSQAFVFSWSCRVSHQELLFVLFQVPSLSQGSSLCAVFSTLPSSPSFLLCSVYEKLLEGSYFAYLVELLDYIHITRYINAYSPVDNCDVFLCPWDLSPHSKSQYEVCREMRKCFRTHLINKRTSNSANGILVVPGNIHDRLNKSMLSYILLLCIYKEIKVGWLNNLLLKWGGRKTCLVDFEFI